MHTCNVDRMLTLLTRATIKFLLKSSDINQNTHLPKTRQPYAFRLASKKSQPQFSMGNADQ